MREEKVGGVRGEEEGVMEESEGGKRRARGSQEEGGRLPFSILFSVKLQQTLCQAFSTYLRKYKTHTEQAIRLSFKRDIIVYLLIALTLRMETDSKDEY